MTTWLQSLQTIGFSLQASNALTTDQGITLQSLLSLTDDDITIVCQAIRKPGGEIRRGARNVPNPGIPVNALAEKRLKLVRFMMEHHTYRINHTLSPGDITIAAVNSAAQLQNILKSHVEPTELPVLDSHEQMHKFLTNMEDTLTPYLGCKLVPITYVVRLNENPPPEATDPSANYSTVQLEMVARAPHNETVNGIVQKCLSYSTDNQRLVTLLKQMTVKFKAA